jgi:serine/threonine-protein kinase
MVAGDTKSVAPRAASTKMRQGLLGPGRRLGRYEIIAPIARGGMAEVWLARHEGELGLSRVVALKTIRADYAEEPSFRKMFLNEARLAARVRHTNVVEVLDLGEEGTTIYLAMPFVEGESMARLLQRRRLAGKGGLSPAVALRIIADTAAGLHAAHELTDDRGHPMQLIHRDVSPQNILVGVDGVAKLTDFGIAKALSHFGDETEPGQVKGKISYLSPEQASRLAPDRRSDVFAAGVVLWEALTGDRLFRGQDEIDTLGLVLIMPIPDPRTVTPDLPDPIAEVVLRALERDPDARFATAAEFGDAIENAAVKSGISTNAKVVAALVNELAGADVEALRAALREASRSDAPRSLSVDSSTAALPAAVSAATPSEPPAVVARSRWAVLALAGILVTAVGALASFSQRAPGPTTAAEAVDGGLTETSPPPYETPPTSTSAAEVSPVASAAPPGAGDAPEPAMAPSAAAIRTPPRAKRPRSAGTPADPAPRTSDRRPKFQNPYSQ